MFNNLTTILFEYFQIRREQYELYRRILDNENLSNQRNNSILQQYLSIQRTANTRNTIIQRNRTTRGIDEMTGILAALNTINSPITRRTLFPTTNVGSHSTRRNLFTQPRRTSATQTILRNTRQNSIPPPPPPPPPPPTTTQIRNATIESKYCDISTNQTICCISRSEFEPNDDILKIIHCEHIFKKDPLKTWFTTKATCPLCRYNIVTGETELLPV